MKVARAADPGLAGAAARGTGAHGADGGLRLTPVGKPRFPDRTYALTLPPGSSVDPTRCRVEENGRAGGRPLGVAREPRGGEARRGARDRREPQHDGAADRGRDGGRTRVRAPTQPDSALGVVTFNSEVATPLPLTTDGEEINRALDSTPALRRETHMYDGVDAAVTMLAQEDLAGGSVIVMSDGADTGSQTRLSAAAAHARAEGVRVFSVGLRSSAFRPEPLQNLAADSRGRYSEAGNGADLAPIYDRLGAELSNEYLVQYRSLRTRAPASRCRSRSTESAPPRRATAHRRRRWVRRRRTTARTSGALRPHSSW